MYHTNCMILKLDIIHGMLYGFQLKENTHMMKVHF